MYKHTDKLVSLRKAPPAFKDVKVEVLQSLRPVLVVSLFSNLVSHSLWGRVIVPLPLCGVPERVTTAYPSSLA